jgi:hypothetical protein
MRDLAGGTGTGKSHLAVAIARAWIALVPASMPRSTWSTGLRPKPTSGGRALPPIG